MAGYLGNNLDMIVHHLAVMTPKCKIFEIKKQDTVYFVPDTLDRARKGWFVSCKPCFDKLSTLGTRVLKINGTML